MKLIEGMIRECEYMSPILVFCIKCSEMLANFMEFEVLPDSPRLGWCTRKKRWRNYIRVGEEKALLCICGFKIGYEQNVHNREWVILKKKTL